MWQDAPKNGAQLFEIASTSGRTHAGLHPLPFFKQYMLFRDSADCHLFILP